MENFQALILLQSCELLLQHLSINLVMTRTESSSLKKMGFYVAKNAVNWHKIPKLLYGTIYGHYINLVKGTSV